MASTLSTTTRAAAPTSPPVPPTGSSSFVGDEFSNNLFSDLAPLLTLFGEQVTKQFLSMSMGWADNILLAMGPLGIITIVVSAIRVSRTAKLKALIGRARESPAIMEQELLSSTSDNVCELWNGQEVVRQLGRCKTEEYVVYKKPDENLGITDLIDAFSQGLYDISLTRAQFSISQHCKGAPNIGLNIQGAILRQEELWIWVAIGVALQGSACVLPGITTYLWKWTNNPAPDYAFPLFLYGSLAIILGVILCSHIVEAATDERVFTPTRYLRSRGETIVAIFFALSGFVCQFVGLRALHWSASVHQLAVTLFMTAVRSWIRRGLSNTPIAVAMENDADQIALAIAFYAEATRRSAEAVGVCESETSTHLWEILTGGFAFRYYDIGRIYQSDYILETQIVDESDPDVIYGMLARQGERGLEKDPRITDITENLSIATRLRVRNHTANNPTIVVVTSSLVRAINRTTDLLKLSSISAAAVSRVKLDWTHTLRIETSQSKEKIINYSLIALSFQEDGHDNGIASTNSSHLDVRNLEENLFPLLSLWVSSLRRARKTLNFHILNRFHSELYIPVYEDETSYMRILGSVVDFPWATLRDLPRWIGKRIHLVPRPNGELPLHNYAKLDIPCWPVFGVSQLGSQSNDTDAMDRLNNLLSPSRSVLPGFDTTNLHQSHKAETCLAIVSDLPSPKQCALEIFSGFMNAVAEKIAHPGVSDDGISSGPEKPDDSPSFPEVLDFIESLAQILVDTGLVTSLKEGKAIIVPPFARRGWLPKFKRS